MVDTVARLQRDLNDMRAESRNLQTPGVQDTFKWMGRCDRSIAAALPLGGGRPKCGPVDPGALASMGLDGIGGCVDRALWFSGTTGGLLATI